MSDAPPLAGPKDRTFRNYTSTQASAYVKGRGAYPPQLIDHIINHHRAAGGQTGVLLDVGCGPGNGTRVVAPHFDVAFGADPGEGMIQTAKELGGTSKSGKPIDFRLCSAEEIDQIEGLEHGSVDMVSAATAAHWFDMPKFWVAAAKVLKPGGTVAIWTIFRAERRTEDLNPRARVFREISENFRNNVIAPYRTIDINPAQDGYKMLNKPWDQPETAALFPQELYVREELDRVKDLGLDVNFLGGDFNDSPADSTSPTKRIEAILQTIGGVDRWRQAHPDLAGTDKDCVKVFLAEIQDKIGELKSWADITPLMENWGFAVLFFQRAK